MLQVNGDRLWSSLMELKEIGAYDDQATGLRGVRRLALTHEDDQARRLVVRWMREAGMSVRVDEIGNVYAVRPGRDRTLPCVLMGSHIDTVATGGAFDGTLGVLGAVEVVRTLDEAGVETLRDIECGFFTEEEGVRFGTDMLGSAVTAGRIPLAQAYGLADEGGRTVAEELVRTGWDGDAYHRRPVPHAYVECHIEQGPILASAGVDVGVVTGVQSISWQRLTVRGEAAHAGTTPIELRHDAGLVAAQVVVELRRMCDSADYGQLRATVGNLTLAPAQTNVIPDTATVTIDLRNPVDDDMTAAEKDLERFVADLAAQAGVGVEWERMAKTAMIPFHARVQEVLTETADELGLGYVTAMSGAGHDAQEIAAICPRDGVRRRRARRHQPHPARVLQPPRLRERRKPARQRGSPPRRRTVTTPDHSAAVPANRGAAHPAQLQADLLDLLLDLIATPSENPALTPGGAGETAIADLVTGWAAAAGLEVVRVEPTTGRPSLLITAPGADRAGPPSLLLCGHLDTVGVGAAGLIPRVEGDRVHGRGGYDMKAGLAAALVALRAAAQHGLERDVVLAAVADEEEASLGIREVLARYAAQHPGRPVADAAIVLEPTELAVVPAHRGFVWIEIEVIGVAAHGSRPHLGIDAITRMATVVTALDKLNAQLLNRAHPLLGSGFLHASTIAGGTEASTIPDRCTLVVERRTIPGETAAGVSDEIERVLDACRRADPSLSVAARTLLYRPPLDVDPSHPFVHRLQTAVQTVLGREVPLEGASYWADSALIADTGVPTLLFGPAGEGAHAADEWVSLVSATACALTILHLIGGTSGALEPVRPGAS